MPKCEVCYHEVLACFGDWYLLADGTGDAFMCDNCAEMYYTPKPVSIETYVHPAPERLQ